MYKFLIVPDFACIEKVKKNPIRLILCYFQCVKLLINLVFTDVKISPGLGYITLKYLQASAI